MSATPIRLPLSQRQADALAVLLAWFDGFGISVVENPDDLAALREVAGRLDTLRERPTFDFPALKREMGESIADEVQS